MIELILQDQCDYRKSMVLLTQIMGWLMRALEEREDIVFEDMMVARDQPEHIMVLLLVDDSYNKKVMDILFQPPGEFKGKYVAVITSSEPLPVTNKEDETDDKENTPPNTS